MTGIHSAIIKFNGQPILLGGSIYFKFPIQNIMGQLIDQLDVHNLCLPQMYTSNPHQTQMTSVAGTEETVLNKEISMLIISLERKPTQLRAEKHKNNARTTNNIRRN